MSDVTITISISAPGAEVSAAAADDTEGPAPVEEMTGDADVLAAGPDDGGPGPLPLDELGEG